MIITTEIDFNDIWMGDGEIFARPAPKYQRIDDVTSLGAVDSESNINNGLRIIPEEVIFLDNVATM